jgi:hypothetical protein
MDVLGCVAVKAGVMTIEVPPLELLVISPDWLVARVMQLLQAEYTADQKK